MTLIIIAALLLDHWLGEPPNRYHPLVAYGQWAKAIEHRWLDPTQSAKQQKIAGLLSTMIAVSPALALAPMTYGTSIAADVGAVVTLYFCIAPRSLRQHALAVLDALQHQDIERARQRVAYIVSRETRHLDASAIRRATIESVLENGADAIFAALFWFAVAGPVGAVLYRLSNTLDALWGYRNERYRHFGWAAARWDDLLNALPARLTAISYALMGCTTQALATWRHHAALLDSPNAGPVMTAGAGSLDLKLGGPAVYHGQIKTKPWFGGENTPTDHDIERACRLVDRTIMLWLAMIAVLDFGF